MMKVAIVGAGPGGLMTARLLEQKCGAACSATVFEATSRIGGKLHTRKFSSVDAAYESGVAECYGCVGEDDPLRSLVADLGLETIPTAGSTVVMQGQIIRDDEDLARVGGPAARAAVESFRAISAQAVSIDEWRGRLAAEGAADPAAAMTGTDLLELVDDDFARRYLALLAHSDLAAEPHQTSARYALRKLVMGLPGYGSVYGLRGGMEELPRRLAQHLTRTAIELNARLVRIGREASGGYALTARPPRRRALGRTGGRGGFGCASRRSSRDRMRRGRTAPPLRRARRCVRSTRPLPARLAALRTSLLAHGAARRVVHARRVRRLLRLRRECPPSTRVGRRTGVVDGGRGRADAVQRG